MDTNPVFEDSSGTVYNKFMQQIIPCRLCGGPTVMLGTKLCDECWELDARVRRNPELALKLAQQYIDRNKDK